MHPSVEPSENFAGSFVPRILIVRVTEGCNAGCFMCSFARKPVRYMWSAREARLLLADEVASRISLVRFTGGEPLLVPHIAELVEIFSIARIHTSLITNGWHLESRVPELVRSGLEQCVLSLDGATPATHDRYRRTPGLFDRAVRGLKTFKASAPSIRLRVNTVVGPHNLDEIEDLYEVLCRAGVSQWSLIPLKRADGTWGYKDSEKFIARYEALRTFLHSVNDGPVKLLGYSADWAGRSTEEVRRFLDDRVALRPRRPCEVARNLIYYTPEHGQMTVCNCVAHRDAPIELTANSAQSFASPQLRVLSSWFHANGPRTCRGCEPINAAFGEGRIDLQEDPFGF